MTEALTAGRPPRYRSYLLRLWQVDDDGQPVWRASLADAHTGERRGFASLAALTAFLAEQTLGTPGAPTPPDPDGGEIPLRTP